MFGRRIGKEPGRRVGLPKEPLESGLRRRGTLGDKDELQVVDDPIHHDRLREEGDDLHLATAAGTGQRVDLVDFADHLRPALRGDGPELFLRHPERETLQTRLLDLPPVGVGVEAVLC